MVRLREIIALFIFSIIVMALKGVTFGSVFITATLWIIYLNIVIKRLYDKKDNTYIKILYKVYTVLVVLFILSFILVESMIIYTMSGFKEAKGIEKLDYVIVLGAGLSGYKVGKTLQARLDEAIKYYNLNKDTNIIVSGGLGKDAVTTEADAMKKYLIIQGVDESKIIEEDKATTTLENLVFSKDILEKRNDEDEKVLIVTSDFHLPRAMIIGDILGLDNEGLASTTTMGVRINYLIREYPTMIIDIIRTYLQKQL